MSDTIMVTGLIKYNGKPLPLNSDAYINMMLFFKDHGEVLDSVVDESTVDNMISHTLGIEWFNWCKESTEIELAWARHPNARCVVTGINYHPDQHNISIHVDIML